ncbi:MAG: tripartite tricarboxylate transporter permease [Chloroflexota bacterium]
MWESISGGLSYLGNGQYWAAFLGALAITVPIALIPGISATLVMALAIPFVVVNIEDPVIGLAMLATLTGVDNTLDSIPAILLGQPGGATQVTFLEGNQLAQRGKAAHTLGAVYVVSAIGGVVGAAMLMVIVPVIKPFILAFGYGEIAAMAMFGVAMVAALAGGALVKGLASALLGIWLGTIGMDPILGQERFMWNQTWLFDGLPLIATTIGMFALPEMIDLTLTRKPVAPPDSKVSYGELFAGARYGLTRWPMVIRQSLFGVFLGAVPGIGSGVVDWLSYAFGIFWSKDKSQFGKGSLDGVLFAESAQNSKEGGQAIPTLAFGVPGGRSWAFVVVAMLFYGIAPGPQMLEQHADVTVMMVMSLGLGNLGVTMLGLAFTGQLAKLTYLPYPVLGFFVIPIAFLSSYQQTVDISAIWILLAGAVIGLVMKQFKWPRPPLLIGFILGPIIEANLLSAVSIEGGWMGVFTRPLFIFLVLLAIITGVVFAKFLGGGSSGAAEELADQLIEGGNSPRESGAKAAPKSPLAWKFTNAQWFSGAIIGVSILALASNWDLPSRARLFPTMTLVPIIALTGYQFVREGLGNRTGQIMDIGMRSSGAEGAREAAVTLTALLAGFVVLIGLIGLEWASVVLALLGPMVIMRNRTGYIGGVVVALAIAFVNLVVFDRFFNVLWPEKFILDWFS